MENVLIKVCKRLFFAYVILLFITACQPATQAPAKFISQADVFEQLPERQESFVDSLEIYVDIGEIHPPNQPNKAFDPDKITLTVYFRNKTKLPLVIRLPQTIGFQGAPGGNDVWDMAFFMDSKNGEKMVPSLGFSPTLSYEEISSDDFVEIGPKQEYPMEVTLDIPYYTYGKMAYHGNLLPGQYSLFLVYQNYLFGFQLPISDTPPPEFDNFSDKDQWRREHTLQEDMNAWVGSLTSQKTLFTIEAKR